MTAHESVKDYRQNFNNCYNIKGDQRIMLLFRADNRGTRKTKETISDSVNIFYYANLSLMFKEIARKMQSSAKWHTVPSQLAMHLILS